MTTEARSLATVYKGWEDYHISLVRAIAPRSRDQLAWRPAPPLRSAGQIAGHITLGRIGWFHRMGAPGSAELASRVAAWESEDAIAGDPVELVRWLEASWEMVESTLSSWTVADLDQTYRQPYQGRTYSVTRQWTIWRVLAHDLHHGGELAVMLGTQGIALPELGDLGGHLTEPALIELA